jgi:hypothetical protein
MDKSRLTHEPDFQLNMKPPLADYLHELLFDSVVSRNSPYGGLAEGVTHHSRESWWVTPSANPPYGAYGLTAIAGVFSDILVI